MPLERSSSYTVCIESPAAQALSLRALDEAREAMAASAGFRTALREPALFVNEATGVVGVIFETRAAGFAEVAQIAVTLFTDVLAGVADRALSVKTLFIEHGTHEPEPLGARRGLTWSTGGPP